MSTIILTAEIHRKNQTSWTELWRQGKTLAHFRLVITETIATEHSVWIALSFLYFILSYIHSQGAPRLTGKHYIVLFLYLWKSQPWMTTGVLRTQTQLTGLPPCKGWNSTLESQEQRYQLPTIKNLSRKLLLLLSLSSLLPIFWLFIPSVALMIWQNQKIQTPFPFLCKVHLLPKAFLGEQTLLWSFGDFMCFISHILLQGQHPQQTGSLRGAITSGYEASAGNWGRASTSLFSGLTPTLCISPSARH